MIGLHDLIHGSKDGCSSLNNNAQFDEYSNLDLSQYDANQLDHKMDEWVNSTLQGDMELELFICITKQFKQFEKEDTMIKLIDVILSTLNPFSSNNNNSTTDNEILQNQQQLILYSFLLSTLFQQAEETFRDIVKDKQKDDAKSTSSSSSSKKKRGKTRAEKPPLNWLHYRLALFGIYIQILEYRDLKRIIINTSELQSLVSMMVNDCALMMDHPGHMKTEALKSAIFHILSLASSWDICGVETLVLQTAKEDGFGDLVAEFLHYHVTQSGGGGHQQDNNTEFSHLSTLLVDQVFLQLKDVSIADDDLKVAKPFARFLIKLSTLMPRAVLKHMIHFKSQIDSPSYTIRQAMMEVLGTIIIFLSELKVSNDPASALLQSASNTTLFIEILLERLRDKKSYVRTKVIGVFEQLAGRGAIPGNLYLETVKVCSGRLSDSASNVRKATIKLLNTFVEATPYVKFECDNGKLDVQKFQARFASAEATFKETLPSEYEKYKNGEKKKTEVKDEEDDKENDSIENESNIPETDDAVKKEQAESTPMEDTNTNPEKSTSSLDPNNARVKLLVAYYGDAVKFCNMITDTLPTMILILGSSKKAEVLEVMEFFVTLHKFGMPCQEGLHKMVHKVWEKEIVNVKESIKLVPDEDAIVSSGKIRDRLCQCYKAVYFTQYTPEEESDMKTAHNLIKLTSTMTLAELTSLEALFGLMTEKEMVKEGVVEALWTTFVTVRREQGAKRRGALVIISMLGKVKKSIISEKLDTLLKVGLGDLAKDDLKLARQACIALQHLSTSITSSSSKTANTAATLRMPADHVIFGRLKELLLDMNENKEWFAFAEEAIAAIYLLSEHPDTISGDIIKRLTASAFQLDRPDDAEVENVANVLSAVNISDTSLPTMDIKQSDESNNETSASSNSFVNSASPALVFVLSKMCFVVGHVAIKQIVHLELIESEWKRRRVTEKRKGGDDLDLVSGSAEDEFSEAMNIVRERELLFSDKSLLSVYGPIISFICGNNTSFNDMTLQTVAVLALCKFMCISSIYCDANLRLLFTILEKSAVPIIKSNIIIGLGDMAICFNSLIDQNISYVYKRLNDPDHSVKKNTLMVLTHLVLNGMVKVKGQISEMAKCLRDPDPRISDLAKLFFTELSTKDNAVYNNMPDIISNLSSKDTGVPEDDFREIMEFLFGFIKKAQHTDNLVEKLCQRFKTSESMKQWRDFSFCLKLIPFTSDKSVKKFAEGFPLFADKLYDYNVYANIKEAISKCKKAQKSGIKSIAEELEVKVEEAHQKSLEDHETAVKAAGSTTTTTTTTSGKGRKVRGVKKEESVDDMAEKMDDMSLGSDDDDEEEEEEEGDINTEQPEITRNKKVESLSSDDDDDETDDNDDGKENVGIVDSNSDAESTSQDQVMADTPVKKRKSIARKVTTKSTRKVKVVVESSSSSSSDEEESDL